MKHAGKDSGRVREVAYVTPVKKNAVGPSEAQTYEVHRCRACGEGGFCVDVEARNPQVWRRTFTLASIQMMSASRNRVKGIQATSLKAPSQIAGALWQPLLL